MSDEDSELSNLLAELESEQPSSTALKTVDQPANNSSEHNNDRVDEAAAHQELVIDEPVKPEAVPINPDDPLDYTVFIQRFRQDYDLAASRVETDRQRMLAIMNTLYQRMQGGTATDIETESLVKLVASLSDTNGHFVKLMDSMSKLLSSAKPGLVINQNIGDQGDPEQLTKLLQQSEDED